MVFFYKASKGLSGCHLIIGGLSPWWLCRTGDHFCHKEGISVPILSPFWLTSEPNLRGLHILGFA